MGMVRRRQRRRVLAAGAVTGAVAYHAGKKHAEQEQWEEPEPTETEYAPEPPADTGPDAADIEKIQQLASLHESGALTDEEFAAAKAKLLA